MKAILISIITILMFFGCTEKTMISPPTQKEELQTPEILTEDYEASTSSSYSKRVHETDIIEKLYKEALDKNIELNNLNSMLIAMSRVKNDSVYKYNKYTQTNNDYWATVYDHVSALSDSSLKMSTLEIFHNLESEYDKTVLLHELKLSTINTKAVSLDDQQLLVKLIITAPMMKNYQVNELPNIETLEELIKQYDHLLKEAKKYSELEK